MLRTFLMMLLGVLITALDACAGPETVAWTEFSLSKHPRLLENLRFLDVPVELEWIVSSAARDGSYPQRTVQRVKSSDDAELIVDSTSFQVLHFRRAMQEPSEQEEPEIVDEDYARSVAEATLLKLAPDAELGTTEVKQIRSGDLISEWTRYYEFWVWQKYKTFSCLGRGIRVTISAYTGRVLSFTNLVPIPPKNLEHTITMSEAQELADAWVSKNVKPEFKVMSVTKPSLELVITQDDHKRRDEVEIWSRLAWVIIVKFADIPFGLRDACYAFFDPVTGEVFDTTIDRVGKSL